MNDYFIWNGVDCRNYGIHVSELPPFTIPSERVTTVTVPGRSGVLTIPEGDDVYEDLLLTAECFISDMSNYTQIASWLRGPGTVTFANRTGGYYKARITNQIPFEKILRGNPHRSFAVNFRCSPPFWYLNNVDDFQPMYSGVAITNPGNIFSEPVIKARGSGDITLMIGLSIINILDLSGEIIIDSTLKEAYSGTTLMNEHISGEFPILRPGLNYISFSGSITELIISPNWRYL